MAELSKIMSDDDGYFYVVPLSMEQVFDRIVDIDPEDWTPEDEELMENWRIDGGYEAVTFMWPVEPI